MFFMTMPEAFTVGETAQVRINGEPVTLTWRDTTTLVINETDARTILLRRPSGPGLVQFICADANTPTSAYYDTGYSIVRDDTREL